MRLQQDISSDLRGANGKMSHLPATRNE